MMPRKTRLNTRSSKKQLRELVNFMMSNADFARDNLLGPDATKKYEDTWQQLANYLTNFGPQRSISQWKATWRSLKIKARSRHLCLRKAKHPPESEDMPGLSEWGKKIMAVLNISTANHTYTKEYNNAEVINPLICNNVTLNGLGSNINEQYLNGNGASENDSIMLSNLGAPISHLSVNVSPSKPEPNFISRCEPDPSMNDSVYNTGKALERVISRLSDIQEDNTLMLKNIGKTVSELLENTKKHNESILKFEKERLAAERDRNAIERERNAIKRERNALIKEKNEILRTHTLNDAVTFKVEKEEGEEETE